MIVFIKRFWSQKTLLSFFSLGILLSSRNTIQAIELSSTITVGTMTQPTSNYYHLIRGSSLQIQHPKYSWVLRTSYLERPPFKAYGYQDQEICGMTSIGFDLWEDRSNHLLFLAGPSHLTGYIKSIENPNNRRSYTVRGPHFGLEYVLDLQGFFITFNHTLLTGITDSKLLEANVAWPFNFLMLSLGGRW